MNEMNPKIELYDIVKRERPGHDIWFGATVRRGEEVHSVGLSEQNEIALEYLAGRLEDGKPIPFKVAEFIDSLGMATPEQYTDTYLHAEALERSGMMTPDTYSRMHTMVQDGLEGDTEFLQMMVMNEDSPLAQAVDRAADRYGGALDDFDEKTPVPAVFGTYQSEDDKARLQTGDDFNAPDSLPRAAHVDFGGW